MNLGLPLCLTSLSGKCGARLFPTSQACVKINTVKSHEALRYHVPGAQTHVQIGQVSSECPAHISAVQQDCQLQHPHGEAISKLPKAQCTKGFLANSQHPELSQNPMTELAKVISSMWEVWLGKLATTFLTDQTSSGVPRAIACGGHCSNPVLRAK